VDIAKVFRHHPSGKQIVVIRDEDSEDGSPSISVLVEPEGLGICANRFGYPDTEAGWLQRDEIFEEMFTEEMVQKLASRLIDSATALASPQPTPP
jgi:hypothetical protein